MEQPAVPKHEVDEMYRKMKECWTTRNIEGFGEFYTEDTIMLVPGGIGPIKGKTKIMERFRREISRAETWENKCIFRTIISDSAVSDIGEFCLKMKDSDQYFKGNSHILWVKVDGEWKVKYDSDTL